MATISIEQFEDTVVIHFETADSRINAYTLASTLVAFADAAKAANATLNPGAEIEVVVEALGQGSFRALLRTIYSRSRNLLANQLVVGVVIGVIGNYIYERTLSLDDKVSVEIKTEEVIIQRGQDRVVVPRTVYDATRKAEKNPEFVGALARTFDAVAKDEEVQAIALVPRIDSPSPEIPIPRESFRALASETYLDEETRVVQERAELHIIKAILDKSKRKWEFIWQGFRISAPVTDATFYVEFFAHDITLAPGDTLDVTLSLFQKRDPDTGIYTNSGYEVVRVHSHTPRIRQLPLSDSDSGG
jgi:hypothetical protein